MPTYATWHNIHSRKNIRELKGRLALGAGTATGVHSRRAGGQLRLVGLVVGWVSGWLALWLVGWLSDWLVGWSVGGVWGG